MQMGVFFIGGASGSGKSTVARAIASRLCVPLLQLDDLHDLLKPPPGSDCDAHVKTTEAVAPFLIEQLLKAGANALVEGGWIQPEGAKDLRAKWPRRFTAVYCGYPGVTAHERFTRMCQVNSTHHLLSGNNVIDALNQQICDSKSYQTRCNNLNFRFVDFSDLAAGRAALNTAVDDWLKS